DYINPDLKSYIQQLWCTSSLRMFHLKYHFPTPRAANASNLIFNINTTQVRLCLIVHFVGIFCWHLCSGPIFEYFVITSLDFAHCYVCRSSTVFEKSLEKNARCYLFRAFIFAHQRQIVSSFEHPPPPPPLLSTTATAAIRIDSVVCPFPEKIIQT